MASLRRAMRRCSRVSAQFRAPRHHAEADRLSLGGAGGGVAQLLRRRAGAGVPGGVALFPFDETVLFSAGPVDVMISDGMVLVVLAKCAWQMVGAPAVRGGLAVLPRAGGVPRREPRRERPGRARVRGRPRHALPGRAGARGGRYDAGVRAGQCVPHAAAGEDGARHPRRAARGAGGDPVRQLLRREPRDHDR